MRKMRTLALPGGAVVLTILTGAMMAQAPGRQYTKRSMPW